MRSTKREPRWLPPLKEYGIIVLGVLTALVVEEAAQSLNWSQQAAAAMSDIETEFESGNGPQAYLRVAIHDCLERRYVDLRKAVQAGDLAGAEALVRQTTFPGRSYDQEAFDGAIAAGVVPHMDLARWRNVRMVYSGVSQLDSRSQAERLLVAELRAIDSQMPLSPSDTHATVQTIEKLRELNNRIYATAYWMMRFGADAGFSIEKAALEDQAEDYGPNWTSCMVDPATVNLEVVRQ